jgi:hypothetical protein
MKLSASLCTFLILLFMIPNPSSGALVHGIATNGSGTGTMVGDYAGNNILYYIPLSSGTPPSGVYGVDDSGSVGRVSDSAPASDVNGWLKMYIEFEQPFDYPAQTASVEFWFKDLDLLNDNDPPRFTESVRFSVWNGSAYSSVHETDDPITHAGMNTSLEPFSITGDNDNRYIAFNDVTSWLPDSGSFRWLLEFATDYNTDGLDCWTPCLQNTLEELSAKLETSPVPEPATMLLLGSGLIVIAGFGRKKVLKKKRGK